MIQGKYLMCVLAVFLFVAAGQVRGGQVLPITPTVQNGDPALLDPTVVAPAPAAVAVPEPATMAMLVLGGALSSLMAIRRNRR